jgi:hypothetical protein
MSGRLGPVFRARANPCASPKADSESLVTGRLSHPLARLRPMPSTRSNFDPSLCRRRTWDLLSWRSYYASGAEVDRLTVAVRRLHPPLDLASIEKLAAFRNSVLESQFDFSLLASRKSIRRSHTEWNSKSFICSSLVAFAYQSIGIMKRPPEGPFPNNLVPADFTEDHNLALTPGYSFNRAVNIVCESSST